jgi:hypothetical protein
MDEPCKFTNLNSPIIKLIKYLLVVVSCTLVTPVFSDDKQEGTTMDALISKWKAKKLELVNGKLKRNDNVMRDSPLGQALLCFGLLTNLKDALPIENQTIVWTAALDKFIVSSDKELLNIIGFMVKHDLASDGDIKYFAGYAYGRASMVESKVQLRNITQMCMLELQSTLHFN